MFPLLSLLLATTAWCAPAMVVGYTGHSIVQPGAHARLEAGEGTLRWGAELGLYAQPGNQVATWLMPRAALRHTGGKGGVYEIGLGGGLLRSFWWAPTFAVEGKQLVRRPLAGDTYATGRVDLRAGHTLDGAFGSWTLGPSLGVRGPHDLGLGIDVFLALDLELGRKE